MAGTKKKNEFKEIISPFLKKKMEELKNKYGENSKPYQSIAKQYIYDKREKTIDSSDRYRHYDSEVNMYYDNKPLIGVERLYKRTILIEPTTVCAAHCRWCLRAEYPVKTMDKENITLASEYFGSSDNSNDVDEVLITGGDPLMSIPLLDYTLGEISKNAKNIKIIRIGTRVPFQSPERINDKMLEMFSKFKNFRFEIGVNINHYLEFWPETISSLKRLQEINFKIYNQNPLLKGVNDDFETLTKLYDSLRKFDIEAHYLFHAIPMRGTHHHRTSLKKGYELINRLSSCGEFSGRAKPKYAVLSDLGKIVIYQDTVIDIDKKNNKLLLKSGFNYQQRKKWNPTWKKPESIIMDKNGNMNTWYQDGVD
jgi:lysine 2,3-aminomutase